MATASDPISLIPKPDLSNCQVGKVSVEAGWIRPFQVVVWFLVSRPHHSAAPHGFWHYAIICFNCMHMRATTFCMVPRVALVAMILLQSISILVSLTPSKMGEF